MHETKHKLAGEFTLVEKQAKGIPVDLPDSTHVVEGQVEAHGATEFASAAAKLSGRLLSVERTDSGGIKYQLALYAHEPVKKVEPVATSLTPQEEASQYLQETKGLSERDASAAVAKFGHTRILAEREKDKDKDFDDLMNGRYEASDEDNKQEDEAPDPAPPNMAKRLAQLREGNAAALPFTPAKEAEDAASVVRSRTADDRSTLDSKPASSNDLE